MSAQVQPLAERVNAVEAKNAEQDTAIAELQTADEGFIKKSGDTMSGLLTLNQGLKNVNISDPSYETNLSANILSFKHDSTVEMLSMQDNKLKFTDSEAQNLVQVEVGTPVEINDAAKSWDNKDKFTVAGLTSKNEIFETIADAIKEGFNPSTAAKIYTGTSIPNKTLNKVLSGEEFELPKDAKFDKERGERFITLCKAAEMTVSLITKRYFIEGFNSYATSIGEEKAFSALKKLKNLSDKQKRLNQVKEGNNFISLLNEVA